MNGVKVRDVMVAEWLKIRAKDGEIKFLGLNQAQREYSKRCSDQNIVLKARQLGITTYIAARFFVQTITRPGTLTVQVAHNPGSAEAIFNIVRRFWEKLPEGLRKGALIHSRANVRQLVFPLLDSEYRVETADANAGRGMTIHNLHCSEVSRWPRDAAETLASLRAAVVPGGEVVLESTPNGSAGVFYDEWQNAEERGCTKHFFPWWYEDSYREPLARQGFQSPTEEERELMEQYGLDAGQIAWRRDKWRVLRDLGAQEYAEEASSCFLASGECVFDMEAIGKAAAFAGAPLRTQDNGRLAVWLPPQGGKQYIIGVDTAGGGSSGDYACAEVIERTVGLQCAELHGHFPPLELARRVAELGRTYEQALLAVERNNHGSGVIAHLRDMEYLNIFEKGNQLGWLTSAATRPAMIENMAAVLVVQPELFRSSRLLEECKTFVRRSDGNTAAADGAHDDCVMAMAIALAVRREDSGGKRRTIEWGSLVVG
ncbi:MAG TPA: terminase [Candidatus Sulfotelmatobacter sp.]|nr:terminase [Candidatus Sulfotelmatobacter sp.]